MSGKEKKPFSSFENANVRKRFTMEQMMDGTWRPKIELIDESPLTRMEFNLMFRHARHALLEHEMAERFKVLRAAEEKVAALRKDQENATAIT
jgi:hypothetical protein